MFRVAKGRIFVWESFPFAQKMNSIISKAFMAYNLFNFKVQVLFGRANPWSTSLTIREQFQVRINVLFDVCDVKGRVTFGVLDIQCIIGSVFVDFRNFVWSYPLYSEFLTSLRKVRKLGFVRDTNKVADLDVWVFFASFIDV